MIKNIKDRRYYENNREKCINKVKQYARTPRGLFTSSYRGQRNSSREGGHPMPTYSNHELRDKYINTPLFKRLYKAWVNSDYDRWLRPSFDRIDPKGYYTFDNIQLMTWECNHKKSRYENTENVGRKGKVVIQISVDNSIINKYESITNAAQVSGICISSISSACNKKLRTAGGFKWSFV